MKTKIITIVILSILVLSGFLGFFIMTIDESNTESQLSHKVSNNYEIQSSISSSRSKVRAIDDWTMFLYGPAHNSYTTAIGPTNANILWYNATGDTTYSSPLVADGRVFLGVGETMKCYYENNGTLAWSMSPIQNVAGGFGVCSSPAYANGCIYFGADRFYCLWATNGTTRWKVDKSNIKHGDGTPTLAYGKVFITGSDYKLYCIDQLNGSVLWIFQAKSDYPPAILDNWGLYAAPAVVNGSVYLSACDWHLYQINITQPTSVATANNTFKMGWASYSSPVVVDDKVYVGCSYIDKKSEARFYCFWASNLTKIWEFYPGNPTGFFSSAGYYNGELFIGSIDGNLYCLNATSGTEVWNYTLGETWSSPAITTERLYIGNKDGYIYCFNTTQPTTPNYYWRYYISGNVDTSPTVVPGRVYIGTHGGGGKIYCFGTKDTNPPQLTSHYPLNDAEDVPTSTEINVTFNEPINPNTLKASSFILKDSGSNTVSGAISYDQLTKTAALDPVSNLKRGETYTVTITTAVQDNWANTLDGNLNNVADGSPADDFSWSFNTSSNNPPTLTSSRLSPMAGYTSTEFEFKVVYTDLDDDSPEVTPGYIRVLLDDDLIGQTMVLNTTATIDLRDGKYDNGEEYIYSTTFSTYGQHQYEFVCFDGIDKIETSVHNDPSILAKPVFDPIGELDAYEDIDLILPLADKLHDEDTSLKDLIITINSSYAAINDLNITFNYPNEFNYPSGRDYEILAINVTDSVHNVTQDVKVNVHAINDPPQLSKIPDIQTNEDEYYYLDLTPHLSDVDNSADQLTVTENSNYATVNDRKITFYYPKNSGVLSEHVEINVSDGELCIDQEILVNVIPEGGRFVISLIPEQNAVEDIELIINLKDHITTIGDLEFNDIEFETSSNYCSISGSELRFNYPNSFNYPSGRNSELVSINVSTLSQSESINFKVNVQAVNDAPEISVVKAPTTGISNTTLSFQVRYFDIDGSDKPVLAVIINDSVYRMDLSSGDIHVNGALFEQELSLPAGEYEYIFRGDDAESENNSVVNTKSYNLKVKDKETKPTESEIDADGDTIPDEWEKLFGLDPNNASDAIMDPDNDGYTNLVEYLGLDGVIGGNDSTDPLDPEDFPSQVPTKKDDKTDTGDDRTNTSDDKSMIIGMVVGIIVSFILILLALFMFMRNKMKSSGDDYTQPFEPESQEQEPKEDLENEEQVEEEKESGNEQQVNEDKNAEVEEQQIDEKKNLEAEEQQVDEDKNVEQNNAPI